MPTYKFQPCKQLKKKRNSLPEKQSFANHFYLLLFDRDRDSFMYPGKKAFGLGQVRSIPISASMLQTTYARKFNVGKKLSLPAKQRCAVLLQNKKRFRYLVLFNRFLLFLKKNKNQNGYQNSITLIFNLFFFNATDALLAMLLKSAEFISRLYKY